MDNISKPLAHEHFLASAMQEWTSRVTKEVPVTANLDTSILVGSVPLILDRIIESFDNGLNPSIIADSNLGAAHGRERALMTDYRPCDIIHELQIFSDIILSPSSKAVIPFAPDQMGRVRCLIDEISRDSLNGYNDVHEKARDLFNSAVSRDVRNLLNVVGVTAQLVQQKTTDPSVESMAKRITAKISEANGMLQAVATQSSLQRNLKLKLSVTQVNLNSLLGEVSLEFTNSPQVIKIHCDRIDGFWNWAAMESAVRHLITYAQRFSSGTGEIDIAASIRHGRLLLSVSSNTSFIAPDELAALFETAEYSYGNHISGGKGMSFVRDVAESHGGSLIIRSSRSAGTVFTINIPLDGRPHIEG